MATLYVTELASLGFDRNNLSVPAPQMPSLAEQAVAIGVTSASSNPFSSGTRWIQIQPDSTCCLACGPAPQTAVLGFHRMAANETRYYSVQGGYAIAVIASS